MSSFSIQVVLQVVVALGLLNVWLLRARSSTSFRGGETQSLSQEFAAYGLPVWFFYLIGTLKIGSALLLIAGIWVSQLVMPAAATIAVLMIGALAMHVKIKDPAMKSLPAFLMLAMAVTIILLARLG